MALLLFAVAVAGGIILERQEKRHTLEIWQEYTRLGWEIVPAKPKLPMLESWVCLGLGVLLLVLGGMLVRIWFTLPPEFSEGNLTGAAFFLASGIAVAWMGVRSVRQNRESDH